MPTWNFDNYKNKILTIIELIKRQFEIKLRVFFDTYKVNRYFQLKSKTPHAFSSNVVYQFTCSCDTNLSYIGMSTRHLGEKNWGTFEFI